MDEEKEAAVYVIVGGLVQGVFFRLFTQQWANSFGLVGYVRNLPSFEVEVYAEGEKKRLEEFIKKLKKGPPGAQVERIKVEWKTPTGKRKNFAILY
jgi:acylphosphatase